MADFFDWVVPLVATGTSLFLGNKATDKAADATTEASQAAADATKYATDATIKAQREMYDLSREDLLPYRETGSQALFGLADLYGVPRPDGKGGFTRGKAFEESPGYQFRVGEGINAIDRSAAARGNLLSGGRLKALTQYGQNMAADEWQNYTRTLQSLAGVGQTATNTGVAAGGNTAGAVGNALMYGGQGAANAAYFGGQGSANAAIAGANNANNALNNLAYIYARYGK